MIEGSTGIRDKRRFSVSFPKRLERQETQEKGTVLCLPQSDSGDKEPSPSAAMLESVRAIFQPTEEQMALFIEMFIGRLPEYIRNSLAKASLAA